MSGSRQFRLLTLHFGFFQLAAAMGSGFIGAYLIKLGFGLPATLLAYAALLAARFACRFAVLKLVRRLGLRAGIVIGTSLAALQFFPLMRGEDGAWFATWLLFVAVAEAIYWPIYHSAAAVTSDGGSRGRELGIRTAVGALVGVLGPLGGGLILERFGAVAEFAVAAALSFLAVLPLLAMNSILAGPIPGLRAAMKDVDRTGLILFAADGWMGSGLALAWPAVLFLALGSHYASLGEVNALSGLVGAIVGLVGGHAIDRGRRDRYLLIVCAALGVGFAFRAGASWFPDAAALAGATGAAVMGLYVPVFMSVIYDHAKHSGEAYRFHFVAEGGWDVGAASGCVAAAALVWLTGVPSLAMLPAAFGVLIVYNVARGAQPHGATSRLPAQAVAGG